MTTGIMFILDALCWVLFLFGIDMVKINKFYSWKYCVGRLMIMIGIIVNTAIIIK